MYTYGQVERALAEVFDIPSDRIGALNSRLKHLQRVGLSSSSPGKGKKIGYSFENAFVWALALEFAELGIEPTVIAKFIFTFPYRKLEGRIYDNNEYLLFFPQMMSAPNGILRFQWISDRENLLKEMAKMFSAADRLHDRRVCIIPFGALLRKLKAALNESDNLEAPAT